MSKYKIGIWGQFGDGGKIADGQAVRTTIITQEVKARYGEENVLVVNTNNWKKHPFRFLSNTIRLNKLCEKVVIFPADNGFKVGVPLFDFFNHFFKKEMNDVVIGGYLPGLLKEKPMYIKMLKKYKALFVQTKNLKADLEVFGLKNIHMLTNLKRLNTVKADELKLNNDKYIKVCTLSRINDVKGIAYAIEAVKKANTALGDKYISLDIYGIPAEDYRDTFDLLLKDNCDFVTYGGVLDFDKTTETLKDYFAMLFPTFYYGEGFPGNVVDAYNAGLPMIATDWLYNKDVIENGKNGILVPIKDAEALCNAILAIYHNREMAFEFSMNNICEAEKYKPDQVLTEFYKALDI